MSVISWVSAVELSGVPLYIHVAHLQGLYLQLQVHEMSTFDMINFSLIHVHILYSAVSQSGFSERCACACVSVMCKYV